jgi:dUTP pyrophosphatase
MEIQVKKLSLKATLPTQANSSDAGWDLYSSEDAIIDPFKTELISTDLAMAIPSGYMGAIWDRSSMAVKRGLHRFAGVIDSGYRGELKVCLWNSADKYCVIHAGERIAQIIFQEVPKFTLKETLSLDETERGESGFGSSGL